MALSGAGLLATAPAWAQTQRIEITGSAIKRIDGETAVPVTVIRFEELQKSGVTSVEQIMATITAVQLTTNAAQSIGSGSGGATFANARGIGSNKTLVLLNGERISNNAVDGSSPDLNMIPFAAIDRIEVLRDGASSLYGTDAIGGVINFITKKAYVGGTATLGFDKPEKPGGKVRSGSVGFGFGDLDSQRFNVFGLVSARKEDSISGTQRPYNRRIVGGLSNSTDPANWTQDFSALYNPSAPACGGTALISAGTQCRIVTPSFVDFSPKSETISGLVKGTFRATSSLDISLEAFGTENKVTTKVAPVPYGGYLMNPRLPNGQPNPYFPTSPIINPTFDDGTAGAPAFNPSAAFPNPVNVQPGFLYVFWRDFPNGQRAQTNKNTQGRLLLSAEGSAGGWDYAGKLSYNRNKVDQLLTGGYSDGDIIGEGLLEGVINPFGAQSAASSALLDRAALNGLLQTATGKVTTAKFSAGRELGDWLGAGRSAQVAFGAEYRREDFLSKANTAFAELVSASTGVDPTFVAQGKRNVYAGFVELNVPLMTGLEVTGSVRYDKYSDFGDTTNPKFSFRYQPVKQVLLRGSASTGFRAPSLYELYGSQAYTNTAGNFNNPVNCPGGTPIAGASSGANCNVQFQVLNGGNTTLKPEKSKTATLGVVLEPLTDLNFGVDFWWIRIKDNIASIPQSTLFANYNQFSQYFFFAPGNLLSITSNCPGPRCGYVDQRLQNPGAINTNGFDLTAQYRLRSGFGNFDVGLNSTYVTKYEYQDYPSGPFNQNVGIYSGTGPVFRWQHNLNLGWTFGAFGAGTAVHYKSGYLDFIPTNRVAPFTTADVYASWSPIKGATLLLGARNVFDRDPPFTNQADLFQAGGWDSRFANAIGRTYYVRATYSF